MLERRESAREACSLEGRVGYAGRYRLRCLILNVSRGGAKLVLKASVNLPREFFLTISREDASCDYRARVMWRKGNTFGVAFAAAAAATSPLLGLRRGRESYKA